MQETDATKMNNTVLSNADKKHSISWYHVLGLTMINKSKSLNIVRNVAVGEGAIARHRVVGGVSARHRQSTPGSADVHHGLDDERIRSSPCNQRTRFEKSLLTNCRAVRKWQTQ